MQRGYGARKSANFRLIGPEWCHFWTNLSTHRFVLFLRRLDGLIVGPDSQVAELFQQCSEFTLLSDVVAAETIGSLVLEKGMELAAVWITPMAGKEQVDKRSTVAPYENQWQVLHWQMDKLLLMAAACTVAVAVAMARQFNLLGYFGVLMIQQPMRLVQRPMSHRSCSQYCVACL